MAIKANSLLKIGVPIVVVVMGGIILLASRGKQTRQQQEKSTVVYDLTKEEQEELGMDAGDTPTDTLRTLLTQTKQIRSDVSQVRKDNERLQAENSNLKNQNTTNVNQIKTIIQAELSQREQQLQDQIRALQDELAQRPANTNVPGIQDGVGDFPIGGNMGGNDMMWINPSDVPSDEQGITSTGVFNLSKALERKSTQTPPSASTNLENGSEREEDGITPVYTIPKNATLVGSVTMTALIGRVPLGGSLIDPFPFKVVIGQENLTANGITLPDIEGAIVSGTATGDWTLSCVTGKVDSITFVFRDGRIQTLPKDEGDGNKHSEEIGWLSTTNGVPCIPGAKKTNAPSFLAGQFLMSAAEAAADGFAQAQVSTENTGNGFASAVTGDAGKYIAAQGLAGGIEKSAEWYRARYGNTFDAIYVPPNHKVAVNITKNIKIDYDTKARKVKYATGFKPQALD